MRILLVEDDRDLSIWLSRLLKRRGFVVDCVQRGDDADAVLTSETYSLVILDLSLPHLSGLEVLRRLRSRGSTTPVLVLTSNDAVSSRVAGLDGGADDYVVKPFAPDELEARIRAQLRRGQTGAKPKVVFGALELEPGTRQFQLGEAPLALSAREHATLEALILRAGRVVAKDTLMADLFGLNDDVSPASIEVYVHRVRRKLEGSGLEIATVRGLGYVLRQARAG